MGSKVRVCSVGEIDPGGFKVVPLKEPIAIFNIDGSYYAINDYCTHERCSLTQEGYVVGGEIECGWHYAKFCIKTGAVTAPPATKPLMTYPVSVEGADVFVMVVD